jgi:hypothetical protein
VREKPTNATIIYSTYYLGMVAPTCFGITLPSSGSVLNAFWGMFNWGAVDRILWMSVLCLVVWGVVTETGGMALDANRCFKRHLN